MSRLLVLVAGDWFARAAAQHTMHLTPTAPPAGGGPMSHQNKNVQTFLHVFDYDVL